MDLLKEDDREINHHGSKVAVGDATNNIHVRPADSALVSRREDVEVQAKKKLYEQIKQSNKNKSRLATCKRIGRFYIPLLVVTFSVTYWGYGLSQMS